MLIVVQFLFSFIIKLNVVQDDVVEAVYTNDKPHPLAILLPNTPYSGMKEDIFQVSQKGKRIKFTGQNVQWQYSAINSHVKTILPGESWKEKVSVSERYKTKSGNAQVILSYIYRECEFIEGSQDINLCHLTKIIQSDSIELTVHTHKTKIQHAPKYTIKNCGFRQWSQAKFAMNTYHKLQEAAIMDLETGISDNLVAFFGDSPDVDTISNVYIKSSSYKFDLECNSPECAGGALAFTFPERNNIYLCSAFFTSSPSGYNSKPGIIVHESTHFTSTGNTQDFAYGVEETLRIAKEDPSIALVNADNYEFYAESVLYRLALQEL